MKKGLLGFVASALFLSVFGQMHVKEYNFTTFRKPVKKTPELLVKNSSASIQKHPEFGVLPYNAQCKECVELIDKRTSHTRFYIDPKDAGHTFSQSSYFPLHYKKSKNDVWRTLNPRLSPDASQQGVYTANNQFFETRVDMNRKSTSMDLGELKFEFNKDLKMFFFDEDNIYSQVQSGNYSNYTVGEEGLAIKDMWAGIDMEARFSVGEIKTNYVITAPLNLPIAQGWMVIEDHFTLPEGFTFERAGGKTTEKLDGLYQGDYEIKAPNGQSLAAYKMPTYLDAKAYGMHGFYKVIKNGNDYALQMYVPVEWLKRPGNTYPIFIDPPLAGISKLGNFSNTGGILGNMAFSTKPESCNYHMTVQVPGKSNLTEVYVDVEYELTYDNTCGNPPLPSPYCTFSQASMEVFCDTCKTTTGQLSCNPATGPKIGTCTTDPNLVPGAGPIHINNIVPNYLACIPPQCDPYIIDFTLMNRDSICGDSCDYLCARGNMWQMTVEACAVHGTISQNRTQVCAGQPVIFTANPECGVPPYHYTWTYQESGSAPVTVPAIYNSPDFTLRPNNNATILCMISDMCKDTTADNVLSVTVVPAPPADAGPDKFLCEGGNVTIGGNPTSNQGVVWSSPTGQGRIGSTTDLNPTINTPPGTVDTVVYIVRATDANCFREDSVTVFSIPNPKPIIDSSGSTTFCDGQSVTLSTIGTYPSYRWNNSPPGTGRSIIVNRAGQYQVTVTDANNCTGTSNTIPVTILTFPSFNVYPDTLILYGDSVRLSTDADLSSSSIDSFTWYPSVNIECLNCPNPTVSPLSDQYYGLSIYSSGCVVTDSALIRIIYPNNFFIPNSFTPNGDGNNDNFFIQSQTGVTVLTFQVFNRWGEKVHDGVAPWDGYYQGKQGPVGVYTYVFKLTLFGNNRPLFRKGSVMLLR